MIKSNIYRMLEKYFDESLIEIAKKMGYSEDNILILEDNEAKLKLEYPDIYDNINSCRHNMDYRSGMEYAQDLVSSWIFEDFILEQLRLEGLQIDLSGNDKCRKILNNKRVSSNSDYSLKFMEKTMNIELVNDYTGYWKKSNKCDLRDNKYIHIIEESKNKNYSIIIGIDFQNSQYFIWDVKKLKNETQYVPYHYAYHKPAYTLKLNNICFKDFSFKRLTIDIKNIFIN